MSYDKNLAAAEEPSKILLHHSGNAIDTVAGIISLHRSKWIDEGYDLIIHNGESFAGTGKKNNGTVNICMAGNWMRQLPPAESINELVRILVQQCNALGVDPSEIMGHRDVGKNNCPGSALHAYLPDIRARVADRLKKEVAEAKPKAKKEVKNVRRKKEDI